MLEKLYIVDIYIYMIMLLVQKFGGLDSDLLDWKLAKICVSASAWPTRL